MEKQTRITNENSQLQTHTVSGLLRAQSGVASGHSQRRQSGAHEQRPCLAKETGRELWESPAVRPLWFRQTRGMEGARGKCHNHTKFAQGF